MMKLLEKFRFEVDKNIMLFFLIQVRRIAKYYEETRPGTVITPFIDDLEDKLADLFYCYDKKEVGNGHTDKVEIH